ncbi:ABC transporter permease subunit [Actinomadura sp. LD22]|uniref:ABC transporter permease subunit n=1 Tax=Actinomadura physcomitrii TaxID=2650748 RepID=A0A6I4ML70_9ACTN|nr:ABC transporter permease [Actinomadura physcomitrii]MWA03459.1 ABC transporter permease subunit [Actinomadura physcomitrii]
MAHEPTPPRGLSRPGKWARGAAGVAVLFLASEALGRAGIVDRSYLPPASDVTARAFELIGDSDFLFNVRVTLTAWALGTLIAIAVAVPLGLVLGSIPAVNTAIRAIVEFLRPIPSVALIPLAGLLLGSGLKMEVPLIVYASSWPILFNTMYGLDDVDPTAKETLRSFGFGRTQVLLRVSLPSAAPFIATGVRLAASIALILAVGTEILSGFGDGLGMFIAQAGNVPDGTRDVLAGTVWAGCLGLIIDTLLVQAENRVFHWHKAQRSGAS